MNAGHEPSVPDGPSGRPIDWASTLVLHDRWLRTVVAARLGERQAVDEVLQEVSLAAVGARVTVDPARVAGWLYRLAIRKTLLYRRSRGRQHKLVGRYARKVREEATGPPDPLGWLLLDERMALVREALARLAGPGCGDPAVEIYRELVLPRPGRASGPDRGRDRVAAPSSPSGGSATNWPGRA